MYSGAVMLGIIIEEKHSKQTLLPFQRNEIIDHLPHK